MATTTTNFGWDIPQSTDLVKDGATAIAALGQDIDTAMVDLKGGTTGQVLAKASGTDLDFSWVAQDDSNAIHNAIVDPKGDLISATAADTPARQAVGTNGQVLTADSAEATGLKWAAAAAGKVAQVLSTTKTDTFSASIAAGGNAAVTGLSQAITPSSATSKVLVTLTMNGYNVNWGGFGGYIARDTTAIGIGDAASSRTRVASAAYGDPNHMITVTMSFLDSPATTSAVTYNGYVVNAQPSTRTVYVNHTETDTNAADFSRGSSTITVMEILA
jgi:hypothetical protein